MNCTTAAASVVAVSVANVCMGFLLGLLVLTVIPFTVLSVYSFDDICEEYNTISSFCADPSKPGNRVLLIMCSVIGVSLALLYCDEYNKSIAPGAAESWRFGLRFSGACLMPLVGLFYTRNKLMRGAPQYYDCGFTQFPILVSDAIHSACALYFLLSSAICAVWGAWVLDSLLLRMSSYCTSVVLALFVFLQAQLRICSNSPRLQRALFITSFVLEFLAIFGLILVNIFVSLRTQCVIAHLP